MTTLAIVGDSAARLWGLTGAERLHRIARAQALTPVDDPRAANLIANAAFAFDPLWLKHLAGLPGTMLTLGGVPVIANPTHPDHGAELAAAMTQRRAADVPLDAIRGEDRPELMNAALRKRLRPFVAPIEPATIRPLQEASYAASYKGVTDLLTKYLWPRLAFHLTRLAAWLGLSPNMVTAISAVLCVLATWLFWRGDYWAGMLSGYAMMVLDTVDGKLARCTITSSWWGNVFDHGIDLVHPPFWWAAWGLGLAAWGTPLSMPVVWGAFAAIMVAYVVQRLIEGAFIAGFGMHIHVWQRFDSRFRLVTARRNPNMAILVVALALGRPDLGYLGIAWWGAICCAVHLVRLGQAYVARLRGAKIVSWLAD